MVTETDEGGHITKHQYDLAGRQISVTQAYATSNAPTTTFTYDAAGRKLTETDPLDHTTTNAYDNAENQIAIAGPTGNFQYAYDNARNRISVTDRNGNASSYQYDSRKHLTKSIYPDGTAKPMPTTVPGISSP